MAWDRVEGEMEEQMRGEIAKRNKISQEFKRNEEARIRQKGRKSKHKHYKRVYWQNILTMDGVFDAFGS